MTEIFRHAYFWNNKTTENSDKSHFLEHINIEVANCICISDTPHCISLKQKDLQNTSIYFGETHSFVLVTQKAWEHAGTVITVKA